MRILNIVKLIISLTPPITCSTLSIQLPLSDPLSRSFRNYSIIFQLLFHNYVYCAESLALCQSVLYNAIESKRKWWTKGLGVYCFLSATMDWFKDHAKNRINKTVNVYYYELPNPLYRFQLLIYNQTVLTSPYQTAKPNQQSSRVVIDYRDCSVNEREDDFLVRVICLFI